MKKIEWRAAAEEVIARERERLGEPPTPEEVAAYSRGNLTEEEATRVRALLVVHPEAAALLTRNVEASPEDVLAVGEMQHDWVALRRRIADDIGPRRSFIIRIMPVAAVLAVATLGVLWVQARSALQAERHRPQVLTARYELFPIDDPRGGKAPAPHPLSRQDGAYLLTLLLYEDNAREYTLEIVDERAGRARTIWQRRVTAGSDRTVELFVPGKFFEPGATYRLKLYRRGAEPVATYLLRVGER